mmetsp:Transcript_7166/g.15659  ORF Transcript_7166/g.15659 Transcript_7166/m.15659 type:complete len:227 (+) Transcript_7166:71-751(+)
MMIRGSASALISESSAMATSPPTTRRDGKGQVVETDNQQLPTIVKAHDFFNLVSIAILNGLNFYYLATQQAFNWFWVATMVYFLLDMTFVGIYPASVKSPVVIIVHHIISALYILIPYHYPQYQWCMAYCMLVEVNTWLLIAKRTFRSPLLDVLFYVTWVGLRNIFYPYLIYAFYKEWQRETRLCGTPWNPILITPLFQLCLTGLNYHWTLALLLKRAKGQKMKQL